MIDFDCSASTLIVYDGLLSLWLFTISSRSKKFIRFLLGFLLRLVLILLVERDEEAEEDEEATCKTTSGFEFLDMKEGEGRVDDDDDV